MNKSQAIALLGGSVGSVAEHVGVTSSAVSLWPEELPPRIADRVQAALWRLSQGEPANRQRPDTVPSEATAG